MKTTRPAWWIECANAPGAPVPWHEIGPWPVEPEEPRYPELPPVLGPAERTRPAVPNPMSVTPPGIDTGTSLLAESLHWEIPKTAE